MTNELRQEIREQVIFVAGVLLGAAIVAVGVRLF